VMLQVPFFTAAMSQLQTTDYLIVIPEHIARHLSEYWPIVYRPLPFAMECNNYWLIWHPKLDNDPAHKWAREQIRLTLLASQHSIHPE